MKKREEHYKNIDEQANKKLSEADELKSSYEEKLANADKEIAAKEKEAFDNLNLEIDSQRQEAQIEAEKIIETAKKKSIKEKEDIIAKAQSEISDIATSMAEKIVTGKTSSVYDEFLKDVKSENNEK